MEILFEKFQVRCGWAGRGGASLTCARLHAACFARQVPAVFLARSAVLASFALGKTTALVVDCGG
jgi:hypothetical protein